MRKRKKKYLAERKYWRQFWRWRVFGEIFFPTTVIAPSEVGITIDLFDIGKPLEG